MNDSQIFYFQTSFDFNRQAMYNGAEVAVKSWILEYSWLCRAISYCALMERVCHFHLIKRINTILKSKIQQELRLI